MSLRQHPLGLPGCTSKHGGSAGAPASIFSLIAGHWELTPYLLLCRSLRLFSCFTWIWAVPVPTSCDSGVSQWKPLCRYLQPKRQRLWLPQAARRASHRASRPTQLFCKCLVFLILAAKFPRSSTAAASVHAGPVSFATFSIASPPWRQLGEATSLSCKPVIFAVVTLRRFATSVIGTSHEGGTSYPYAERYLKELKDEIPIPIPLAASLPARTWFQKTR